MRKYKCLTEQKDEDYLGLKSEFSKENYYIELKLKMRM